MQPIFALFIKAEIRIIKQKPNQISLILSSKYTLFSPCLPRQILSKSSKMQKQISPSFPIIYKQIITSI